MDGTELSQLDDVELHRTVSFFAEDAHIFATTVRDNLLVARGDCPDQELTAALDAVGLGGWLVGLPEGLSTVLTGGAQALSTEGACDPGPMGMRSKPSATRCSAPWVRVWLANSMTPPPGFCTPTMTKSGRG